jgi:TolA-binding protein
MKIDHPFWPMAAVLWLTLCLLGPATLRAADAEADPQAIIRSYQAGRLADADRQAAAYLETHPTGAQRCAVMAAGASAERAVFEVRQRLRRVADECPAAPEGPRALADLARLLHLAGQDRAALQACDEFFQRYPEHELGPATMLLRGAVELSLPTGSVADDSFHKFLAKWPDHPHAAQALAGLADAKLRQGDWATAEAAYRRALAAAPELLDLPVVYLNLGLAAEKQGRKDAARRWYRELAHEWPDADAAAQARERLDGALAIARNVATWPPAENEKFAASVGLFPSLKDAEKAAAPYTAAGMRVRLVLRDKQCEALVGEFDSESDAALFAKELAKRFQVAATPARLP